MDTYFNMLAGLDEFSQKGLQFCVPLNEIGEIALQVLLFKKGREKCYSVYFSTLVCVKLFNLRKGWIDFFHNPNAINSISSIYKFKLDFQKLYLKDTSRNIQTVFY